MTASISSKQSIGGEIGSSIRFAVKPLVMVCAWCERVRSKEGDWLPVEQRHVVGYHDGRTSHGMCPECAHTLTRELDTALTALD